MKVKKLTVKQLCTLAMLIALTAVLSYFTANLRIGNSIKFTVSFISVYISGALFGPLLGGFVGAAADVISYFINPVGAYIWQFTFIEFIYGFLYGLIFYKNGKIKKSGITDKTAGCLAAVAICVILQFAFNIFVKTYFLMSLGFMPDLYWADVLTRLPSCAVMAVIKFIAIFITEKTYIKLFYSLSE